MIGSPITTNASRVGWGGRIRTFEYGIQSPAPYRLATPHRVPFQCPSADVSADLQEWPPLRGANGKCIRWAYLAARPGLARRQAARESVRVIIVCGDRPAEIARAARVASDLRAKRPNTAEPLPDMAAWAAPARRKAVTIRAIAGCRFATGL